MRRPTHFVFPPRRAVNICWSYLAWFLSKFSPLMALPGKPMLVLANARSCSVAPVLEDAALAMVKCKRLELE